MIVDSSNYPMGGAVSTVEWKAGCFRVTTAKEGFFSLQSTMISMIPFPGAPMVLNRTIGKIMWADGLRKSDRQNCHH